MRTHSYKNMLKQYETTPIDSDDLNDRQEKLSRLNYSVIVEGSFLEYENAEKWIQDNLNIATAEFVFYGKTGYDYGFIEYFFAKDSDCQQFKKKIPDIYTKWPDGSCSKSDGYGKFVERLE